MLEFKRADNNKALKRQVKKLYKKAFPPEERIPSFFTICKKAKNGKGELFSVFDEDTFIGLAQTVAYGNVVYLYFLAVEENLRGKGFGGLILQGLKEIYRGKKIILNIEELNPSAENYAERLKRQQFYKKNGFELADVKSREGKVVYDLMVYGGTATYAEYAGLMRDYWGNTAFKRLYGEIK